MGERKVLNKYFPPDFDPAALPRGKKGQNNEKKVRMMLPMSVRCNTCGNFMYKGTKFNTRMEDVAGELYLGLKIFRFYYRCTQCAGEFCMKTDPKSTDYIMEGGATRNYEPWRETAVATKETAQQREQEEMGNAMKALENRTLESKREMDIMAALDEMVTLNARHNKVSTSDALIALKAEAAKAADAAQAEQDADDLAEFYQLKKARVEAARVPEELSTASSSDEDERGPGGSTSGAAGEAGPSGSRAGGSAAAGGAGPSGSGAGGSAAGGSSAPAVATVAVGLEGLPEKAGGAKPLGPKKPVFKVMAKPKAPVAAAPAAKKEEAEEDGGGGLAGLLGGYGSSGSAGSQ
ncbi:hypothetical protein FOA52_014903 [Chlamydomonas sp. UWO 241]|nr:hypothetical protein FOA52_014903 [Chlamydomonas sp. UWO 241]